MHENQPGFASRGTGLSFLPELSEFFLFYINKKKNELKKL